MKGPDISDYVATLERHSGQIFELHSQNAQSIRDVLLAINENTSRVEKFARKVDSDRVAVAQERDGLFIEREAMMQEVQRCVLAQQESLEKEKIRMSSLFINLEVNLGNIEKRQQEECERLRKSAAEASIQKMEIERRFKQLMEEYFSERRQIEEDKMRILSVLNDELLIIKEERMALNRERKELQSLLSMRLQQEEKDRIEQYKRDKEFRSQLDELLRAKMELHELQQNHKIELTEVEQQKSQLSVERKLLSMKTQQLKDLETEVKAKYDESLKMHKDAQAKFNECQRMQDRNEAEAQRLREERESIQAMSNKFEIMKNSMSRDMSSLQEGHDELVRRRQDIEDTKRKLEKQLRQIEVLNAEAANSKRAPAPETFPVPDVTTAATTAAPVPEVRIERAAQVHSHGAQAEGPSGQPSTRQQTAAEMMLFIQQKAEERQAAEAMFARGGLSPFDQTQLSSMFSPPSYPSQSGGYPVGRMAGAADHNSSTADDYFTPLVKLSHSDSSSPSFIPGTSASGTSFVTNSSTNDTSG